MAQIISGKTLAAEVKQRVVTSGCAARSRATRCACAYSL